MKLFRKYFLVIAASTLAAITLITFFTSFTVRNSMAGRQQTSLMKTGQTIASMAAYRMDEKDYSFSTSSIAAVVGEALNASIYITDTLGNVTVCNCSNFVRYGTCSHEDKAISAQVLSRINDVGSYYEVGNLGGVYDATCYIAGVPVMDSNTGQIRGYVFVSSPAAELRTLSSRIVKIFLLAMLIPMSIIFFGLYYVNYRFTRPLRMMSEAARAMARGDFSRRIPVETDDEIGELAVAFNNMSNSLSRSESMRRSFVANVSHELKTPMTTIGGFIDGILDGTIPESQHDHYLTIVSEEVKRLSRLVVSMLNMSKLESGEMKVNFARMNLSEVILTSVFSLEQKIENKSLEIRGLDKLEPLYLMADKDLIHQVIYNLTDNAVKFTEEGGAITFSVGDIGGGMAQFRIRNTGAGIASKELPHVFERFYKTDRSRSQDKTGTGLGLYIVKTIIDIHGGSITVSSVQGEYTEFEVNLPTHVAESLPAQSEEK